MYDLQIFSRPEIGMDVYVYLNMVGIGSLMCCFKSFEELDVVSLFLQGMYWNANINI
jgi:hypothetical protein